MVNIATIDCRYKSDKDLHTSSSREHRYTPDEVEHKPGQHNLFTLEIEDDEDAEDMFITHF
jgi:hypothetical protein